MGGFDYSRLSPQSYNADYRSYFTFNRQHKQHQPLSVYSSKYNIAEEIVYSKQKWMDYLCTTVVILLTYFLFLITFPFSALFTFKLVRQFERFIVYRLGRLQPIKGPGVVLVLPCIDRYQQIDMRTKAFNVPPSKVCTSDGYIISIGAIIQFRINDPLLMSVSIQNVDHAMRDSAMSDMTNLLSKKSYSDIKIKRQSLAYDLQLDVNHSCREWGIELSRVELSDVTVIMVPQNKSSFMPMHGTGPPIGLQEGTTLNGLAQIAQHFLSNTVESKPTVNMSEIIFKLNSAITPELINEINASYEFDISGNGMYFLDLTFPNGSAGAGNLPKGNPDVKISMSPDTLQNLLAGSMSSLQAYTTGKLLVNGSISVAKKLDRVFESL